MRDLIPWGRARTPQRYDDPRHDGTSPFLSLHRDMNRLFDDAFRGFGFCDLARGDAGFSWPQVEVADLEKELRVTAELPGLEEKRPRDSHCGWGLVAQGRKARRVR